MKKQMINISGVKTLTRENQKLINGGITKMSCPSGCFTVYLQDVLGRFCAVPGSSGNVCYGQIRNELCCL